MRKIAFLCLLALLSCTKMEQQNNDSSTGGDTQTLGHGMIVLGEQLDDPYTVDNMSRALQKLYPSKSNIVVGPNGLYMRFLPEDQKQYDALVATGITLLDHPVDYKIIVEGDYYHDPEVEEEKITWQYATVPVDYVVPEGIKYELLDEIFIPDNTVKSKYSGVDWDAVERESFAITGNGGMLDEAVTKGGAGTPSGTIEIIDDKLGSTPIGVKGVMVSCNVFVKFASCYTDENGRYKMSRSFSANPRYRMVFKNKKGFGIGFNLILIPGSISGMGVWPAEGISVVIDKNGDRNQFCRSVVNNACYDYFESCEEGGLSISLPPSNLRFWIFQFLDASSCCMLQHGAFIDNTIIGRFLGAYSSLVKIFLPDVTIGVDGMSSYDQIYTATQHECAHASHWSKVGNGYWDEYIRYVLTSWVQSGFVTYGVGTEKNHGYCEIGEIWAYYVQTVLYRERYKNSKTTFGTGNWFYPQILLYLDERGVNRFKIFQALSDQVTDKDALQSSLISLYPEMKSVINQAFGRYQL